MTRPEIPSTEARQARLFDEISSQYTEHYSDEHAQRYRREFFNEPMFRGIELDGRRVLEAMCGSGQTTEFLLERGARVTGLDLSSAMVEGFRARFGDRADAVHRSILETGFEDQTFDVVVVVGGLHHVHPNVERAIDEIHRVLVPGGWFCFVEPHAGSLPDLVRALWYRFDRYFEDNEASIDLEGLASRYSSCFEVTPPLYLGNIGYLLVYNSLILRAPKRLKQVYSGPAIVAERTFTRFMTKRASCFAVSRWRKLAP